MFLNKLYSFFYVGLHFTKCIVMGFLVYFELTGAVPWSVFHAQKSFFTLHRADQTGVLFLSYCVNLNLVFPFPNLRQVQEWWYSTRIKRQNNKEMFCSFCCSLKYGKRLAIKQHVLWDGINVLTDGINVLTDNLPWFYNVNNIGLSLCIISSCNMMKHFNLSGI